MTGAPQINNTIWGHLVGSTLVVVSLHQPRSAICAACEANRLTSGSLGLREDLEDARREEEQSCVRERHLSTDDALTFLAINKTWDSIFSENMVSLGLLWSSAWVFFTFSVIKSFTSLRKRFELKKNPPDAF